MTSPSALPASSFSEDDFSRYDGLFPEGDIIERVSVRHVSLAERTRARGIALQVLYEADQSAHPLNIILKNRFEAIPMERETAEFAARIVLGVHPNAKKIDSFLIQYAPEWPIDQIAIIDRNIIRIAVWEFGISQHVSDKVAINEAVELAKAFGSERSSKFVNGVLGSFSIHVEEIRNAFTS